MNDDRSLVERARAGEKAAWKGLWERHAAAVRRVASGFATLSAADVDDVVQETFVKAHRHIDSLRDAERIRPWLLAVARSRALDRVARRRSEAEAAEAFVLDPAVGPFAAPAQPEGGARERRMQLVRELIDGLPEGPEKETVHLFYVEGRLSAREIAERMGVGKSAVTMRLERFRAKVKRRLAAVLAREGQGPWEAVG